jgi:4-aminobutyrate aminotransferase
MAAIAKKMEDIMKRDRRVFLSLPRVPYPFVVDHGEGEFAYDVQGKKFIDFSSFIGVYNMGVNSNAKVRNAIKKQVDKLMHNALLEFYSELPLDFAELLVKMFPQDESWRVFLSNSGTEAIEAAIKFSNIFTKRYYNMAFYNAFHGRTKGALGLTNSKIVQREYFGPFSQSTIHVPFPYCYRCPFSLEYPGCGMACVDYIKKYPLSKEVSPKEVAAFFAEPVQGEGGYIVPPVDYFKELKKLLDESGILLVADEVQAGYMRTGKFLSLDNFGVKADMYTMAKAVGAGLPLGVTIVNAKLGDIPVGSHSNTFGGNLAVIAGAYEQLKEVRAKKKALESQIKAKGAMALKRLKKMQDEYEIVGDARGIGLMLAIELVKDKKTKEPAAVERREIVNAAFDQGLLLLEAGQSTIRIAPPVTISEKSLHAGLDILDDVVRKANSRMLGK